MAYKKSFLNSVRFGPNPWIPKGKQFYKPSKHKHITFVISDEKEKISTNMCRLSLLFPTIKINYIFKILKLHNFNITHAIDTLLFLKTIQKQTRRGRYHNQNISQQQYLRKFTCARCLPFKRKSVLENILEEDVAEEQRVILPNITFGNDTTTVFYEDEPCYTLSSAQIRNEINVRFETSYTNEEIQVSDPDDPPGLSTSNNSQIKLRVLRETSGRYSSQLIE